MDDLLSFLYTGIDTLSLVFFLDAFATRRWDNWKFKLGVGCFVALLFWVLQVPFVFFGRDQAMKIGMILLSYTISARVLYKEISDKMLLLLVCIEYLVTYYLLSAGWMENLFRQVFRVQWSTAGSIIQQNSFWHIHFDEL